MRQVRDLPRQIEELPWADPWYNRGLSENSMKDRMWVPITIGILFGFLILAGCGSCFLLVFHVPYGLLAGILLIVAAVAFVVAMVLILRDRMPLRRLTK